MLKSTTQTTAEISSRETFFTPNWSIIAETTTSTDENTLSIPNRKRLRKNKAAQRIDGLIVERAWGNAMKTSSKPWVSRSGISIPVTIEMCPRTAKMMNPARIDVALKDKFNQKAFSSKEYYLNDLQTFYWRLKKIKMC